MMTVCKGFPTPFSTIGIIVFDFVTEIVCIPTIFSIDEIRCY